MGLLHKSLAKEFKRPAIVLEEHTDGFTGSIRSYNDYNLRISYKKAS